MKRFKTKIIKNKSHYIIFIVILSVSMMYYINYSISESVSDIISTKLEEYANLVVKKRIVPKNVNSERLVKLYFNDKKEIIYSDIDMKYANDIMIEVVEKIQNDINELFINDDILTKNSKYYYVKVPISIGKYYTFISNLSPKIPVKVSYYEHSFGNIDLELLDYGINNALLKVYLTIDLEQKVYVPYNKNKFRKQYRVLIGSKIINGTIPNIYGGKMTKSSSII